MEKQEVIDLMKSSKNSTEWNTNCDKVKKAHNNGYPDYWYSTFVLSGLMYEILGAGASQIKIKTISDEQLDLGIF